jgi:hypothetical protein
VHDTVISTITSLAAAGPMPDRTKPVPIFDVGRAQMMSTLSIER